MITIRQECEEAVAPAKRKMPDRATIAERDRRMVEMRANGASNQDIARELKFSSAGAVADRFSLLKERGRAVPSGGSRSEATLRGVARKKLRGVDPAQVKERRCLYCGQMRLSTGPHDRLHDSCRQNARADRPYWAGKDAG